MSLSTRLDRTRYAACWCGHRHSPDGPVPLACVGDGNGNLVLVCGCRRCFASLALTRRLRIEQLQITWREMRRP